MVDGDQGCRSPPSARRQLAEALALVAVDPEKRPGIPFLYALDQLAQRWHVHPSELERDPDWLIRGLEFMRLEASVKVSGTKPKGKRG